MVEEKKKKRINWYYMKDTCPKCQASNIVWTGIYRRKWFRKSNGQWELKEQQKRLCEHCGYRWWV